VWRALVLTMSLSIFAPAAPAEAQPEFVRSHSVRSSRANSDPCRPNDRPCWEAHIAHQRNVNLWWAEIVKAQRFRRDMDRLARWLAAQAERDAYRGSCGGSLPSCAVLRRESGGDPRIWNGGCYAPYGWRGLSPCGRSSASGRWQIVRGTWNYCRTGYVNAADAPVRVQDDCARKILRVQPCAWCL